MLPKEKLLTSETKEEGLSKEEAKKLLEKHGPNELPEKPPPSDIKIFSSQLKSPLVYILIVAGLVTLFLGHYSDTIIIAIAVLINTVLGFFQERKANRAFYALKKLIQPKAEVVRGGERKEINVEEVVPGDICILNQGDKVPADGEVIKESRVFMSEAILTGESVPVAKDKGEPVYMGTIVTSGNATMRVRVTGEGTEVGKIATSIQEPVEETPLRRQMIAFSKQLALLVLGLTLFVFIVGLLTGKDVVEIFTTSVALAVSAIPEGLLVGMTVVLAIGMQRILKRKGLVRNLVSAETLGSVTTICVDKTGTLTEGKMRVVEVVGDELELAKQGLIANDLDDPIVIAVWEWANKLLKPQDLKGENIDAYLKKHPRIDSIPFSSKERFFASLNKVKPKTNVVFVNGAPEFLLEWCSVSQAKKKEILGKINQLTSKGMRVVGMAKKEVDRGKDSLADKDVKEGLEWVGMLGLSDPVRGGVSDALEKTQIAGLKTLVITGDYAQTAQAVMEQVGIEVTEKQIVLGSELEKMKKETLAVKLRKDEVRLFARTTPEQKLKIVKSLKENGEIVAMMGDGVNDAPALKRSDIGVVVGNATDVAKETADLILLDSNFATIVEAVEEGRGIFDNIRKIILYLMTDAFSEIIAVVGALIFGMPLPVTAAQILWINLVSDGFPHLALTVDPKAPFIMKRPPRPPKEPLVASWMKILILIVSGVGGIFALIIFTYLYKTTGDVILARSVAFATLGVNSLVYVFSLRTLHEPFWRENPFENKWLNFAVIVGLLLQLTPFSVPATRGFFKVTTLSPVHWIAVFSASFLMFIIIELMKAAFRSSLERRRS